MQILVLNSGSSSIKFKLFSMNQKQVIASGLVEKIGELNSYAILKKESTKEKFEAQEQIKNHQEGFSVMKGLFFKSKTLENFSKLDAIGHRIVHGGEIFKQTTIVDDEVISKIEQISPLAPLHNPAHIEGIKSALKEAKGVKNVVVFDTVFHQTLPPFAYTYALPYELYESLAVRKYGFHGTSHLYVSKTAANFLSIKKDEFNAITLHLGNGASATAIKNGKSIDTSMGLTPLEGLVMGTRSGDLDPAVMYYLSEQRNYTAKEIDQILNKQSGLKGICGTNDMREVIEKMENGDEKATLAFEIFIYRIKKYIGSYYAILGRVDALIFTGGIGENSQLVREKTCENLEHLGIKINKNKPHNDKVTNLSTKDAKVQTLVVQTDEELEIAEQTLAVLNE